MKNKLILRLAILLLGIFALSCESLNSECPPQWYFNIDDSKIPTEANPAKSIKVSFLPFLNDSTDNTQPVLYYFEVPTIFENPKGDLGYYLSEKDLTFAYKLKDSLNPPREITLEMKTINECTTDYQPKHFTLIYDTVP